jgi:hypothetical protein
LAVGHGPSLSSTRCFIYHLLSLKIIHYPLSSRSSLEDGFINQDVLRTCPEPALPLNCTPFASLHSGGQPRYSPFVTHHV